MGCLKKMLDVRDLSNITMIDETTLSKIMNNKRPLSFEYALRIGAALDLDPVYLMNPSKTLSPELQKIKDRVSKISGNKADTQPRGKKYKPNKPSIISKKLGQSKRPKT